MAIVMIIIINHNTMIINFIIYLFVLITPSAFNAKIIIVCFMLKFYQFKDFGCNCQ